MERKYVKTSFGRISYLERNGDYPLIFLHGLGGSGNNWLKLDPFLDPEFHLYFIDLPGHGKSDKIQTEYTVDMQSRNIMEFIDILKIGNFSLIGNSYGGWISMYIAIHYHEPDHLVLIDSAGINRTVGEMDENYVKKFVSKISTVEKGNDEGIMRNIIINNAREKWKMSGDDLKNITADTIIIWGSEDSILDPSYAKILNEKIKGSRIYIIEGAKHTPQRTHPERVAEIINENITSR